MRLAKMKAKAKACGGRMKRASGGSVGNGDAEDLGIDGESTKKRGDRSARKSGTTVNIVIASKGGPSGAGGLGAAPPGVMMPPAPLPPPRLPPGAPMMRKKGGRVEHSDEAQDRKLIKKMLASERKQEDAKMVKRAKGGRLGMTAGAESGPGRLEKTRIQKKTYP